MVFITISDENNIITSMDVHEEMNLATIACLIENDYKLNMKTHELIYNGKPVKQCDTIKSLEIKEGDLLFIRKKLVVSAQDLSALAKQLTGKGLLPLDRTSNQTNQDINPLNIYFDEAYINREVEYLANCKYNRTAMAAIKFTNEELYNAIMNLDFEKIRKYVKEEAEKMKEKFEQQKKLYREATQNPLSEESQKFIADSIRNDQIRANYEMAKAYMPDSYRKVFMLYIPMEIHKTKLKAFIDSGAQCSVISKGCAEACNILNFLDKSFSTVAVGVGVQKTLGRVHWIDIKIGNKTDFASITVIESNTVDFIFGLDLLRYFKCCIDLKQNALIVGDEKIPFLEEKDIPLEPMFPDS